MDMVSTAQSYTDFVIGMTLGTASQVSNNLVKNGRMIKTPNVFQTYNLYRSNGALNGNQYISGRKFLTNVKAINALNDSKVVKSIGFSSLILSGHEFYESRHPVYISRGIISYNTPAAQSLPTLSLLKNHYL